MLINEPRTGLWVRVDSGWVDPEHLLSKELIFSKHLIISVAKYDYKKDIG